MRENNYQTHMVVDPIDNRFMRAFWCHPERFFVIDKTGTLLLKAQPIDAMYRIQDLAECLNTLVAEPVDPDIVLQFDTPQSEHRL